MKPIHFPPPAADEAIRAVLEDRKTVTRRAPFQTEGDFTVLKGTYFDSDERLCALFHKPDDFHSCMPFYAPYQPGDILYVRETWTTLVGSYLYKADQKPGMMHPGKWRPSIHMPKEAARIFLRVKDVRVEHLQEISELDILEKEGLSVEFPKPKPSYMSLAYTETRLKPAVRKAFADLWETTIKPADRPQYGWEANPWVWVISFRRISREEAGL